MKSKVLKVYYLDDQELLLEAVADRFAVEQILIETFSNLSELDSLFAA